MTRGLKAIKTRLIKTLGIKVSFQRAFEDGQRRAATDSVGQTVTESSIGKVKRNLFKYQTTLAIARRV